MIDFIPSWLDLTMTVAVAGLSLSLVNSYFAWRRGRLAAEQEKRRILRLDTSLIHSFYQNDEKTGDRSYAFQLTVRNPSDSNNAISEVDLAITYLTTERIQMTVKIRANEPNSSSFVHGQQNLLEIPNPVTAHNTISGWLRFRIPAAVISGNEIESYKLILRDTHGDTTGVVPILVQEYRDET